jgi:hypothetical protein
MPEKKISINYLYINNINNLVLFDIYQNRYDLSQNEKINW